MVLTTDTRRAKSPTLEWLDAEMGDPVSAYQNDYLESISLLVVMTVAVRYGSLILTLILTHNIQR